MLSLGVPEAGLATCLRCLSEWGAIQYYPAISALQDLVILDPHWTSDFFKSLISHKRGHVMTQEGVVVVSDMEEQWEASGIAKQWFPSLWSLLTEFELLVRIQSGCSPPEGGNMSGMRLFALPEPSLAHSDPQIHIFELSVKDGSHQPPFTWVPMCPLGLALTIFLCYCCLIVHAHVPSGFCKLSVPLAVHPFVVLYMC